MASKIKHYIELLKKAKGKVTITVDFQKQPVKKTKQSKNQKRWYDGADEPEDVKESVDNEFYKSEFYKQACKDYLKSKRQNDPIYRLKTSVYRSIRKSLFDKSAINAGAVTDILGCTVEEFKEYIERKWEPWMNWENYGNRKFDSSKLNNTWDLDHITPLVTAKSEEDVYRLNHYTNFQPLCSVVNRFIKRDKILKVA